MARDTRRCRGETEFARGFELVGPVGREERVRGARDWVFEHAEFGAEEARAKVERRRRRAAKNLYAKTLFPLWTAGRKERKHASEREKKGERGHSFERGFS